MLARPDSDLQVVVLGNTAVSVSKDKVAIFINNRHVRQNKTLLLIRNKIYFFIVVVVGYPQNKLLYATAK